MKNHKSVSNFLSVACAVLVQCSVANAQQSVTTTSTITSDGTVAEIIPGTSQIMLRTSDSETPVSFLYNKSTMFVDSAGNTVTYDTVRQNTPARIFYTKVGESYVVTKVVVNPGAPTTTVVTPVTTTTVTPVTTTTVTPVTNTVVAPAPAPVAVPTTVVAPGVPVTTVTTGAPVSTTRNTTVVTPVTPASTTKTTTVTPAAPVTRTTTVTPAAPVIEETTRTTTTTTGKKDND